MEYNKYSKKYINISDVSSFIGQNNYDFVPAFERLLKKFDSYNKIVKETTDEKNNKLLEIEQINISTNNLLNDFNSKKITKEEFDTKTASTLHNKEKLTNDINSIDDKLLNNKEKLLKVIGNETMTQINNNELSHENKQDILHSKLKNLDIKDNNVVNVLIKQGTSIINTNHGTHYENDAIKMFENKFKVKLDTTQNYNSKLLYKQKYEWYFGGKVDGLYIDKSDFKKSYIVEVKNRVKAFFNTIRDYEKTQIILYMELLNIPRAKLVENLKSKLRITDIYIDKDYSNDILKKLELFIIIFENFLEKEDLQKEFFMNDSFYKRNFIQLHFFNKINEQFYNESSNDEDDEACLL